MDNRILSTLFNFKDETSWPNSWQISKDFQCTHEELASAIKSLEAKEYLQLVHLSQNKFAVTEEGLKYAKQGTPEFRILQLLLSKPNHCCEKSEIENQLKEEFKIGLSNGIKRLFKLEKTTLVALSTPETAPEDAESVLLAKLSNSNYFDKSYENEASNELTKKLKKRQLIDIKSLTYYQFKKGPNFSDKVISLKADLTAEDLAKETWKHEEGFKGLNLSAKGKEVSTGGLHPLLKMRSEFRQILLEMGFEEMKTNNFVESSFWNFDSLFQPQQHPARDSHDTFFLKTPVSCTYDDEELNKYVQAVKHMH